MKQEHLEQTQEICLIDFGLANFYINPVTGLHIKERKKNHFLGTVGFSSLNSHSLKE
jgi:serine/threonine protein kinase